MASKFKKLVKAYAAEHGYSYQAALNIIRKVPLSPVEAEALLERYKNVDQWVMK